jgi:hypothetical protein
MNNSRVAWGLSSVENWGRTEKACPDVEESNPISCDSPATRIPWGAGLINVPIHIALSLRFYALAA